jgi:hypothetical protein
LKETTDQRKHWTGIFILLGIFIVFIKLFETNLIFKEFTLVTPLANTPLDDWLIYFQIISYSGLGCAFLAVALWYYWGSCRASFHNIQDMKKAKFIWGLLCGILCAILLISFFITIAQEGIWIAYLFYTLNILGFYYSATVWFSPVSVMDIPPGSTTLRFSR